MLAEIKGKLAVLESAVIKEPAYTAKGFHLDVKVDPEKVVDAAQVLDEAGFFIEAVTGVDMLTFPYEVKAKPKPKAKGGEEEAPAAEPEEPPPPPPPPHFEVVYDFNHFDGLCRVVVRTVLDRDNPEVPTISALYPGANWHEREQHDFFGIKFSGHPDLSPLLLPEDADFHPLLKDYNS